MIIEVFSKGMFGDDTVGSCFFKPSEYGNGKPDDQWHDLLHDKKPAGRIRLRIQLMQPGERALTRGVGKYAGEEYAPEPGA